MLPPPPRGNAAASAVAPTSLSSVIGSEGAPPAPSLLDELAASEAASMNSEQLTASMFEVVSQVPLLDASTVVSVDQSMASMQSIPPEPAEALETVVSAESSLDRYLESGFYEEPPQSDPGA